MLRMVSVLLGVVDRVCWHDYLAPPAGPDHTPEFDATFHTIWAATPVADAVPQPADTAVGGPR